MQCLSFFFVASLCAGSRLKDKNGHSELRGGVQAPRALLEELEDELGKEHREATEKQLEEYERDLRATFLALPKNDQGTLEAPSARYALHRLFSQRHGWQIKGLENSGGAWDAASPMHAMGDYVPPKIRELLEDRLKGYGLSLHELAVLAATIDNAVLMDVKERLDIILQSLDLGHIRAQNVSLRLQMAIQVFHSYVCSFILGSSAESLTVADVSRNIALFEKKYPARTGAMELEAKVISSHASSQNGSMVYQFNYSTMVSMMADFGKKMGAIDDKVCKSMKARLISQELSPGTGRVRLGDFYDEAGSMQFSENVMFLREHGILDESDPSDLSVIIPNYLHSTSNCFHPSGYYAICCFDECEALMDRIEAEVAAPVASSERIASVVASLEIGRDYNRSGGLTPTLQTLLTDISNYNGGSVPIHGRFFSQWMHQAFPRECAHPSEFEHERFDPSVRWRQVQPESEQEIEKHRSRREELASAQAGHDRLGPIGHWQLKEQLVDKTSYLSHIRRSDSYSKDIIILAAATIIGAIVCKLSVGHFKNARNSKDLKLL